MSFTDNNPIKVYKRISVGFIILTVILLFFVMYMALSRGTVIIQPKEEVIQADLVVGVKEFNLGDNDIYGKFATTSISGEGVFSATTDVELVPDVAEGTVMIYNKSTNNQILIPTTRLLSESGVLFRLKDKINVPAGSSIVAEIYADKEGAEGNLEPTTFTIPGLSSDLQKKIYAEAKEPITGGLVSASAISEEDVATASIKLRESLILQVSEDLKNALNVEGLFDNMAFTSKVTAQKIDSSAGKSNEFKLLMDLDVIGVAYSDALKKEAEKTLNHMVTSDKVLISSNIAELKPVVEKYNAENGSATLKVALIGKTVINDKIAILDKAKLAGKSRDEVNDYLTNYPSIESVEIRFFPFWLKSLPTLRDHIKIIVK